MPNADQTKRQVLMGQRVKEAREALGMTQEDLALALGIDQSNIPRYESGAAVPRAERRRKLERLLKLEPGELNEILEPEAARARSVRNAPWDELWAEQRTTNELLRELVKLMKPGQ